MHQPVENTAYCLNCTNEWSAVWDLEEIALVCPECRWQLGVPAGLVSSGWWTTQEYDRDTSSMEAEEYREERERAKFVQDVREDLERLPIIDHRRRGHADDAGKEGGATS
jgi:hypothetical protein